MFVCLKCFDCNFYVLVIWCYNVDDINVIMFENLMIVFVDISCVFVDLFISFGLFSVMRIDIIYGENIFEFCVFLSIVCFYIVNIDVVDVRMIVFYLVGKCFWSGEEVWSCCFSGCCCGCCFEEFLVIWMIFNYVMILLWWCGVDVKDVCWRGGGKIINGVWCFFVWVEYYVSGLVLGRLLWWN